MRAASLSSATIDSAGSSRAHRVYSAVATAAAAAARVKEVNFMLLDVREDEERRGVLDRGGDSE